MTESHSSSATPDFTASSGRSAPHPTAASAEIADEARRHQLPPHVPQPRGPGLLILGILGVIALSFVLLFVVVYVISGIGTDAFAIGGVLAVVPLAVVFFAVRWIDRWEPEPRLAVVFAFLWGAGVAVLLALIVGAEIDNVINSLGGPGPGYAFFSAAIQAPIVEEAGKALGILVIFWVARRHFDGPVDGLVYGAWIAGGFAFTENILYFGSELLNVGDNSTGILQLFLIRGLMSPFAHVMFTACTGIALGFAVRSRSNARSVGVFAAGLGLAIALHALWNGALFFVNDFFGYYAIVQVPLFVIAIIIVVYLRRQEERMTFERLAEYANAGWFNQDEVPVLATSQGRRRALAWAAQHNKRATMKVYIQEATRLAFARQRIITGRDRIGAIADEAVLLGAIVEARHALTGERRP
ncbi:PrsW family intramembrane metalloprotease [Salinibacterium sp. NSLL150]|uniref:PrsW family intramembrane metalloprotease n=1 Tax=unclassified Salinibacterium TaxID=2632331 RepID=UPI0018CCEB4A|nr:MULTISPECIES: PrsW family intramembrane metalloprotease [unclassified Salinibacterium]MBH0100118.1 PrsW family intramembrane metalloprotease [Salinibacterium sp. NSLL35]MBH0102872.1 PrsW family intramembrane metalloprotease [Salinibacterium sp. NSLL150]MBH0105632.1 PrsW family intramembrane metalloprotease [Salinibacterium sp. NSLL16]MBH0108392.1 PrsW family intramembrane metalloprotease [Salinibacterium sp. NSLL17]